MATATKWNPFGVALNITATAKTVTRTSATQYKVALDVSWESYYTGNKTNYGMRAISGGVTSVISQSGIRHSSGSSSFTGTYSISGDEEQDKTITVKFENFNSDNGNVASKSLTLGVTVPAWISYEVSYDANGGSGAPASQTKWKDTALILSTTKPKRAGYTFLGWGTSKTAASVAYTAGGSYTNNAAIVLYAVWKAKTFTVSYDANGGSGAPANQTKTYGVNLTLSATKPTRASYTFLGWGTSANDTTANYSPGGIYANNTAIQLYAVWELSYIKPTVKNLNVYRCTSDGIFSEYGTYFKIEFEWSCDQTMGVNKIKSANYIVDGGAAVDIVVDTIKTNGAVSIVGGGNMSIETTHVIEVVVYDTAGQSENNYTKTFSVLPATRFPIDIKANGKGVAIGGPASLEDIFDMFFQALFRQQAKSICEKDSQFLIEHGIANVNAMYEAKRTDTGINIKSGIGSDGGNHGLYSNKVGGSGGWIICAGSDGYVKSNRKEKVLWESDGIQIGSEQSVTLSESISRQLNGIILVWQAYDPSTGATSASYFNFTFIPKAHVESYSGKGISILLSRGAMLCIKYIYITNTAITGNSLNTNTAYGVYSFKLDNTRMVLTKVYGV